MELLLTLLGGLVVALIGAIGGAWLWEALRDYWFNRPFRRVLNFQRGRRVTFVFPTRDPPPGRINRDVAWEDMQAVDYITRAAIEAGHRWMARCGSEQFTDNYKQDNLVLICSPISNTATETALKVVKAERPQFDIDIVEDPATPSGSLVQWKRLQFFGGQFQSPSFRETDRTQPLVDWGVIAKVHSPTVWNPHAKILFVIGIRAIGTWGAAKFLFEHVREIHERYGDGEFAFTVQTTHQDFRIIGMQPGNWHDDSDF